LRVLLPHLAGSVMEDERVEHLQPIAVPVAVGETSATGAEHDCGRNEWAGSGSGAAFDKGGRGAATSALEAAR